MCEPDSAKRQSAVQQKQLKARHVFHEHCPGGPSASAVQRLTKPRGWQELSVARQHHQQVKDVPGIAEVGFGSSTGNGSQQQLHCEEAVEAQLCSIAACCSGELLSGVNGLTHSCCPHFVHLALLYMLHAKGQGHAASLHIVVI